MANTKEQQLQAFARRAARVSKALWPTNVRRSIATGRAAQTRRQLILSTPALTMNVVGITVLGGASILLVAAHLWLLVLLFITSLVVVFLLLVIVRRRASSMKHGMNSWQYGAERRSFPGVLGKAHFPNTPMPVEPPLVRVLETFDLSQTNVEHFLELPEGGNTGGYSLEGWKEAQTSLPRTARK
jgi:hypothetical protein